MPYISVTPEEWYFATEQLNSATDGTKLGYAELPTSFSSKHSFIKIKNKIYCLAKGKSSDPILPHGSVSAAKYAQDEQGNLYIVKIDSKANGSPQGHKESAILLDLSIGLGTDLRADKNKQYTVLKYLGKDLHDIIKEESATLSEEKRLDLATKFAWQVYRLHHGLLSISKTAYAHHDIKPDNVTVDELGNVHLIDFGLTQSNPHEKSWVHTAASYYTAYEPAKRLTGAELDTVSLKRSLFLPQTFYSHQGFLEFDKKDYQNVKPLLPQDLLDKYNLNEFVNTFSAKGDVPDYDKQIMDPLVICAALINAKEHLGISEGELRNNLFICHAIVGVYFSTFSHRLKEIIINEKLLKLAGVLHVYNNIELFDKLRMDEELSDKINEAKEITTASSLFKINQLNLTIYHDLILNSQPTAKIIEKLAVQNRNELISDLLKHHSDALVNVLLFASQHGLEQHYEAIINNSELIAAIESFSKDAPQRLIDLMKNPAISVEEIISFCQDKDKRNAVDIILDNDPHNIYLEKNKKINLIKNALQDKEIATAIINLNSLPVEKYDLYQLAFSKEKCSAFNVLFDAKLNSNEALSHFFDHQNDFAEIIPILHERGWNSFLTFLFEKQFNNVWGIKFLLKSGFSGKLTEQMLLDDAMRSALLDNQFSEDLITLYTNNLYTKERYAFLKQNLALFKQVIRLIETGYSSFINESTLNQNITSVEDFMLNLVVKNHRVIQHIDDKLKNTASFMLAATARDYRTLEYASDNLKSSISFISQAVRINHKAFIYAIDDLRNDPMIKLEIKRTVLHYDFTSKSDSRFHLFKVNVEEHDSLKEKYKNKKGDALKTAILKEFKQSLEGKNQEEINELVIAFNNSIEYRILCTTQGLISSIFSLGTSSANAVEKIIEEALELTINNSYANSLALY